MQIPYQELQAETLLSLVESFILREGTDYGDSEASFTDKTQQVMNQIHEGKILIMYSELHESCDLIPASKFNSK